MTLSRRQALQAAAVLLAPALLRADDAPTSPDDLTLPELVKRGMPSMMKAPVAAQPLSAGLSMITGPGGNVAALSGPDGFLLVDSFVPGVGAALLATFAKLAKGPVSTLVDTHWHFDHTGGNAELAAAGARIVAHANVRKRLSAPQRMSDFQMDVPASPPAALPVATIGDEATLYTNGEEVRLVYLPPSHTDGDIYIHFAKANVLHCGDVFGNGGYPNIDKDSGGWIGGMVAASDILLAVADASTKIIPGHGPLGTKADLKAARDMYDFAWHAIAPMVEAGKTLDEVIAAKPLKDLDAKWGRGLLRGRHFAQLVYGGLAKRKAAGA